MTPGVLILLVVIAFIGAFFGRRYYDNNKRNKLMEKYLLEIEEVDNLDQELQKKLNRSETISKTEEVILAHKAWSKSYEEISSKTEEIKALYDEADKLSAGIEFNEVASKLEAELFEFKDQLVLLKKRVSTFVDFEHENSKICITLIKGLEDLEKDFNIKLKALETYDASFEEETAKARDFIKSFEEEQKVGKYPEAREFLMLCSKSLEDLSFSFKTISNTVSYLQKFEQDLKKTVAMINEFHDAGFNPPLGDFEKRIEDLHNRREDLLKQISNINFSSELTEEVLDDLSTSLVALDDDILTYYDEIFEQLGYIKQIIALIKENDETFPLIDELIQGAQNERDTIEKLYSLDNVKQVGALEEVVEEFNTFREQYDKLLNIAYECKEDSHVTVERFRKSKTYLTNKLLIKLREIIQELKAIRMDEITVRDGINTYNYKLSNLELYLYEHQHRYSMSVELKRLYKELENSLADLKVLLEAEPLAITAVRNTNIKIEKLLNLIETNTVDEVKKREGVHALIQHINNYYTSFENQAAINRIHSLYAKFEYKDALAECSRFLDSIYDNSKQQYMNILSSIDTEKYELHENLIPNNPMEEEKIN